MHNSKGIDVGSYVNVQKGYKEFPVSARGLVVEYSYAPSLFRVLINEKVIVCHLDELEKIDLVSESLK